MKKQALLRIGILAAAFNYTVITTAQITFEEGTWSAIKAKTETKLIFINANTGWCGPCKWISKNTFTNDRVANFFNTKLIN